MHRVQSLLLFISSLCMALAAFSFSKQADACLPPPEGWQLVRETLANADPVPPDGVVAFELRAWSRGPLSVEVTDPQGAQVDGRMSMFTLDEGEDGPPGREGRYLVVWKPASDLAATTTYNLSVKAEHPYDSSWLTVDEEVTFETTGGPAGQLPTTTISSASVDITEVRGGFECCTRETLCDSCGYCEWCWATRYAYRPQVSTEFVFPHESALASQVYTVFRAGGVPVSRSWRSIYGPRTDTFSEHASAPYCVEVSTFSLIDGTVLGTDERCFNKDALPPYTERELTGEGPPAECQPDAGGSDAGSMDVGAADTGSDSRITSGSGGGDNGGCTQSGPAGSPLSPALLAIFALAGLGKLRRRRTP